MYRKLLNPLRAILILFLLLINMLIVASVVVLLSGPIHLLPYSSWRHNSQNWLLKWPVWWMDVNFWIMQLCTYKKWHMSGYGNLDPNGWYILICNHRSWLDILILGTFFRHKIPLLKFFMKKDLIWSLPLAGLACYVLDYPFMARHSHDEVRKKPQLKGKDIATTQKACIKFKEFPTTVMNFVEGTRFSWQKHQKQQSPYQMLLKPKAMGTALVIQEMHRQLNGILDVTLAYSPREISFWQFLCGNIEGIYLHYELLPVSADLIGDAYTDRTFRKHIQQWLNQLWHRKDQILLNLAKK